MSIKYDKYMPLYAYLSPASIPQIVAHIQDYLVKHPILSVETIAEIIVLNSSTAPPSQYPQTPSSPSRHTSTAFHLSTPTPKRRSTHS